MAVSERLASLKARSASLHPYLVSAGEQAIWSVMNVGVGLLLIRLASPVQYGVYAFWANCGFVLSSLQNALTLTHLLVLPPSGGEDDVRRPVERLMLAVTLIFLAAVAAAVLVLTLAMQTRANPIGVPAAAVFVPAFLLQQYVRSLAFSRGRPGVALWQTAMVLALGVGLLTTAAFTVRPLSADWILGLLGAAYGVVGLGGLLRAMRGHDRLLWRELGAYAVYARRSAWIFLGVSTTELLARFYAFVVAGWYGPAALATLSATQLVLRPVPLLATSWSMVARSELAGRRERADWSGFLRVVAVALGLGAAVAAAWTGLMYKAWPFISSHVFGGKYAGVGWMVLLWGVSSGLSFGQVVVGVALQILRAFKPLALANTAASIAAAVAVLLWMRLWPVGGAIAGTATGQGVELIIMTLLLLAYMGRRKRL